MQASTRLLARTDALDGVANSKSWMTQALFEQWVRGIHRRWILRLVFLLLNMTAKLQLMNQQSEVALSVINAPSDAVVRAG